MLLMFMFFCSFTIISSINIKNQINSTYTKEGKSECINILSDNHTITTEIDSSKSGVYLDKAKEKIVSCLTYCNTIISIKAAILTSGFLISFIIALGCTIIYCKSDLLNCLAYFFFLLYICCIIFILIHFIVSIIVEFYCPENIFEILFYPD